MTPAPPELEDGVEYLEGWVVVVETGMEGLVLEPENAGAVVDEEEMNEVVVGRAENLEP